ncbi:hypothetical protein QZH41_019620 [Actinostola sp. cb2023]|nr:hypothetical protein QZH41_019620 [Actinostola sp. cb2023]
MCKFYPLRITFVCGLLFLATASYYLFNDILQNNQHLWLKKERLRSLWEWNQDSYVNQSQGAPFMIELNSPSPPEIYPTPQRRSRGLPENTYVTPGITKKEYIDRRHNLMRILSQTHYGSTHDKHVVIIPSNPDKFMTTDVPYPFRQNTDFLYLTGFQEPDAVLILETQQGNSLPYHKSLLFVRPRDPRRELWEGSRAGVQGAINVFGVDEAYSIKDLTAKIIERYSNKDYCIWYDHLHPSHPRLHAELKHVLFATPQFKFKTLLVLGHNLHMLRLIKSPSEIKLMRRSGSIASQAIKKHHHHHHYDITIIIIITFIITTIITTTIIIILITIIIAIITITIITTIIIIIIATFNFIIITIIIVIIIIIITTTTTTIIIIMGGVTTCLLTRRVTVLQVMSMTRPGLEESHLHTTMEYECRIQGAERLSYPPVVAGGSLANTLHYINNTQLLRDGDLVLMDAGCEYHGYASDITRTWPVNGTFSETQRQLYDIVLRVQKKCLSLCRKDVTLDFIHHAMLTFLGEELISNRFRMSGKPTARSYEIGILSKDLTDAEKKKAASDYCPHHVSHYLGMDTHDTHLVSRGLGLQPGMIVTIEPGLYIPGNAKNVPKRFHGIGIRIEDDVLITENGHEILSEECPKEPEEIEKLMQR